VEDESPGEASDWREADPDGGKSSLLSEVDLPRFLCQAREFGRMHHFASFLHHFAPNFLLHAAGPVEHYLGQELLSH
jgi:hypothetical protein